MRVNRRGELFEYKIFRKVICFVIFEIINCLDHQPFWRQVYNKNKFDMEEFGDKLREIKGEAIALIKIS